MNEKPIVVLVCFVVALALLGCSGNEPLAFLSKIEKKDVFLKKSGQSEFKPVIEKTGLFPGDVVKTSNEGEAIIQFSTGSVVRLHPDTEYELKTPQETTTGLKVFYSRLIKGVAVFYVPQGAEAAKIFEVETEMAVASIRGTRFRLSHIQNKTTLTVKDGKVAFRPNKPSVSPNGGSDEIGNPPMPTMPSSNEEIMVEPGNQIFVDASGLSKLKVVDTLSDKDFSEGMIPEKKEK